MIIKISPCECKAGDRILLIRKEHVYSVTKAGSGTALATANLPLRLQHYEGVVTAVGAEQVEVKVFTYAPLHTHSGYSLLDGAIRIRDLVEKTEFACALTDHGTMYGFLDFYKKMKAAGKKPIVGVEVYTEDLNGEKKQCHMVLLAKNEVGLKNLMTLSSDAYNHFYKKPHVTMANLREHKEGIIATSACLGGLIPRLIQSGDLEGAERAAVYFRDLFGPEDFYLEIQRHGIREELSVNAELIRLSKRLGIGLVAAVDAHYTDKEDAFAQEVLLCLQTGKTLQEPHMKFDGTGYHLMSSEEMEALFHDLPEALDNTLQIASRCNLDLELNNISMPDFQIPPKFDSKEAYFEHLCHEGFRERFEGTPKYTSKEYLDRFEYEIEMIKKMKFPEYFLVVWDMIHYARENGIMVGPGRGSAVGSLISYCLRITDIDPIPYGLLFERFLNPERVSWPDIDTDFDDTRRDEVIQYLTKKYGEGRVCKIITFGTLSAKAVVRDVTRVMGHPPAMGNRLSKLVPDELKMTLTKALNMNIEFKTAYDTEPDVRKIVDVALRLEGLPRHASQHACGLVISKDEITKNLPTVLAKNEQTGEKETTSQVTMTEVEELGLLKMDILGLRTMGVIGNSLKQIEKKTGKSIQVNEIPLDDPEVYRFLQEGKTAGVFQLESPGMTSLIQEIYADIDHLASHEYHQLFERLIAAVSLYRPGPMDYIPTYIRNMSQPDCIEYDHPNLEPILKNTYGVIVYQEQVMQIVQSLAGYSLGRADIVRKAMGKKQAAVMEHEKKVFVYGNAGHSEDEKPVDGCIQRGVPEDVALIVWDKMKSFAEYAFNKSHATAYAYIAVVTAWLSRYFPEEFSAALLNSVLDKSDKLKHYLFHCHKKQIPILPPDVNLSDEVFVVENGNAIRFGLLGITSIGKSGRGLIRARGSEPFSDIQDLARRLASEGIATKTTLEALVFSGAMDSFEGSRYAKIEMVRNLLADAKSWRDDAASGQISLADLCDEVAIATKVPVPNLPEYPGEYLYKKEKEYAGFYLSGHPLEEHLGSGIQKPGLKRIGDILDGACDYVRASVETVGMITDIRTFYTRNQDVIYNFVLEDQYHSVKCVVFSKELEANRALILEDVPVVVKGTFQNTGDWGPQIIVSDIFTMDYLTVQDVPSNLEVEITSKEEQDRLVKIIDDYAGGDTGVVISASNRKYPLKKKICYSPKIVTELKENFSSVRAVY